MVFHLRVLALALCFTVGCKKSDKTVENKGAAVPPGSGSSAGSATVAPKPDEPSSGTAASEDMYAKPTLTEDKLIRYIKSLGEGKNPYAILGAVMGPEGSLGKADAVMKEQEAFAKKYGFSGAEEYLDVTGRIMIGQTIIMASASLAGMREFVVKSIADQEKLLADPNTPADEKASLAEAVKEQKEQLADMDGGKNDKALNAADLALVKKFNTQLEAAQKANEAAQKK